MSLYHLKLPKLTEAIGVLDPVDSVGCFRRCCIDIYVIENDIGSVHHVDGPKLRLYDVEVANINIADIPEHERHWPARTCSAYGGTFGLVSLVPVPDLAIAINTTCAVAVNADVIASENKTGCMILKLDVVVVVPPVFEILRELKAGQMSVFVTRCAEPDLDQQTHQPLSSPVNVHVVDYRVQTRIDVVRLVRLEDDVSSVTTLFESFEYSWDIVGCVGLSRLHSTSWPPKAVGEQDMLC